MQYKKLVYRTLSQNTYQGLYGFIIYKLALLIKVRELHIHTQRDSDAVFCLVARNFFKILSVLMKIKMSNSRIYEVLAQVNTYVDCPK